MTYAGAGRKETQDGSQRGE